MRSYRHELMAKFLIRGTITSLLIIMLTIVIIARFQVKQITTQTKESALYLSDFVADLIHEAAEMMHMGKLSENEFDAKIQEYLEDLNKDKDITEALVVDRSQRILASLDKDEIGSIEQDDEAVTPLTGQRFVEERSKKAYGQHVICTGQPVIIEGVITYAVVLDQSLASMDSEIASIIWQVSLMLGAGMLVLFLLLGFIVNQAGQEIESQQKQQEQLKTIFGNYVSPEVAEVVLKNPAQLKLGGNKQQVTVLFSDIRGFTRYSEQTTPERVVTVLNRTFSCMTDIIIAHGGMIDKFIGDSIMVVFGAPFVKSDDTDRAVQAAVKMQLAFTDLKRQLEQEGMSLPIEQGIGIHCGPAIVGNIGSHVRMNYTVIGDTVNFASRLESTSKAGQVIVSEDVLKNLTIPVKTQALAGVKLKGKSGEYTLHIIEELQSFAKLDSDKRIDQAR